MKTVAACLIAAVLGAVVGVLATPWVQQFTLHPTVDRPDPQRFRIQPVEAPQMLGAVEGPAVKGIMKLDGATGEAWFYVVGTGNGQFASGWSRIGELPTVAPTFTLPTRSAP